MLRIMLDTIDEGSSLLDLEIVPEDLVLEFDGVYFTSDVSVNLKFYRQTAKIYVKAVMSVDAEMECSRCLAKVPIKIKAGAEVQYSPLPKFVEDQIDDIGIGYYTDEYIDITDELRESILLEIPMIILCSEDCKGLCSQCGQNLNIKKCDCPEFEDLGESKLAVLTKLLDIKGKLEV
ncbi:TPA: DUF177 domain-containing protein [bacterium]|nr:DUF177 domain-containing protein [bacterium]